MRKPEEKIRNKRKITKQTKREECFRLFRYFSFVSYFLFDIVLTLAPQNLEGSAIFKFPILSGVILIFLLQQPAEITAKFQRAVELQRQGALEEAAAEYQSVIKSAPNYAEAHANLGSVMSRLGKYDEAVQAYESALRLDPKLTPILLNLGIAHYRAEKFDRAAEALERFLASAPENLQARQLLGVSLIELGRDADGIAQLEPLPDLDDPTALYSLGLAYLRLNRSQVQTVISRLARSAAGKPLAHLLRGQLLLNALEVKQAAAELEEAAQFDSGLPRLQFSLGLSYLKLGRSQDALACFERELRQSPQDFSTLYYLAYVQELSGNLETARGRVEEALKQDPQSPPAKALLAKILFKQNKAAEAVGLLEAALEQDPADSEKHYLLGRIYRQLGRRKEAEREFAEVQRLKNEAREREKIRGAKPQSP